MCLNFLTRDDKNVGTMLMSFNHSYIVYFCKTCLYTVDFTLENRDIRPMVVAAAYRRMSSELMTLQNGEILNLQLLEKYQQFVRTPEFVAYSAMWQERGFSFWSETKYLLQYLSDPSM